MATKLKFPNCSIMCKEEGDEGKVAKGEYRVYDSMWNSKSSKGEYRVLECLSCGEVSHIADWDNEQYCEAAVLNIDDKPVSKKLI